jgi:hypothetical protein
MLLRTVPIGYNCLGKSLRPSLPSKQKGILTGIRVERAERGSPGEFDWLDNLSADELRELITKALQDGIASGDVIIEPVSPTMKQ